MCQLVIVVICEVGEKYVRDLVEFVVSEIGMGCVEDKFVKNVVQVCGMSGVECFFLQVLIGDNGLILIENVFWDVVVLVILFINLVVIVINNVISLIVVGNSVIFVLYLVVKKVFQWVIMLFNQVIVVVGGLENLLVIVVNLDIEIVQCLFKFLGIGFLVVIGGEVVVEVVCKYINKCLIVVGVGNLLVVVDEIVDFVCVVQFIVKGVFFDNNIICVDEKVLIVVDSVVDELMCLMEGQYVVKLIVEQVQQL